MRRNAALCALSAMLAFAGCTVGPDYRSATDAELGVPKQFVGAAPSEAAEDLATWWERFSDPTLSQLVQQALTQNLDIARGVAQLRQAREGLTQAHAGRLPSASMSGSAGRNFNHGVPDTNAFSQGFDASWSADLAGGLRRGVEASRASLDAAGFSLNNVRTAIAAEVGRNYVDARSLDARVAIARDTLKTQDDNLQIAEFRAQAGLVSSLDVVQARAQRAQTAATIPSLIRAEAAARYRLAVLSGRAPGAVSAPFMTATTIFATAPAIAIDVPANTLRRRPDVRVAERNLAAATAQIGAAEAQRYPSFTLSGNIGSNATSITTLRDVITGGVFVSVAQTLFDGGRLRSVVRQRAAAAEESFAVYKSTVLTALEDIENALVALDSAQARGRELSVQVEASTAAALFARSNYRAGLADFRTLLDAERTLLSARDGLASARGDEATALIQLYLALGGGWIADAAR